MLPMTLQFLIAMIAAAINDRLQRKLDYVEEERHILQEQLDALTGGKKLSFTAHQRRRLATAGKQLTPDERRRCCRLVKPETIFTWFRQLAARKYDSSKARRGRPAKDVRKLVIQIALANPWWPVDRGAGRLDERPRGSRQGRLSVSAGWDVEFLLPRGRLIHDDEFYRTLRDRVSVHDTVENRAVGCARVSYGPVNWYSA